MALKKNYWKNWYREGICINCFKPFHKYRKSMKACSHKCRASLRKNKDMRQILLDRSLRVGDCLEWQGAIGTHGYGVVGQNAKIFTTHRLSYSIFNGEIPKDLHILHKCDNRKCINPEHLFAGTNLDNIRDRISKGR